MKWKNKIVQKLTGGSLSGNLTRVSIAVNKNADVLIEAVQKIDELSEEIEQLKAGGYNEN